MLLKHTLVRIPNSVYAARPGVDQYRPEQATPVPNLFLAGDFTRQEFMASIEGAMRSAKRAVERIDSVGAGGQGPGARGQGPGARGQGLGNLQSLALGLSPLALGLSPLALASRLAKQS